MEAVHNPAVFFDKTRVDRKIFAGNVDSGPETLYGGEENQAAFARALSIRSG